MVLASSLDIGKSGIEKVSNLELIGNPGKREIEVNAYGKEIREIWDEQNLELFQEKSTIWDFLGVKNNKISQKDQQK